MGFVAGLFVGGLGSRMGGVAKGLLSTPDGEVILGRTCRMLEAAGGTCVLVGAHPAYADYAASAGKGLTTVADDPSTSGPLAGILALLTFADHTPTSASGGASTSAAIAVACDMPFLTADLIRRLVEAPAAPVVAPRRRNPDRGWLWEPLFARYDASVVLPIARRFAESGGTKLQRLLDAAGAVPLALGAGDDAALVDWDTPADAAGSVPGADSKGLPQPPAHGTGRR